MMNNTELAKALTVMVTDPKIRSFLEDNDPMALKQATEALRNYFNQYQTTHYTLSGQVPWTPPIGPADYYPDWDFYMKPHHEYTTDMKTEPLKWGPFGEGGSTPLAK